MSNPHFRERSWGGGGRTKALAHCPKLSQEGAGGVLTA